MSAKWFKSFFKAMTAAPTGGGAAAGEPVANFTPLAQQVLMLARQEADRLHHNFIGTEHLLLGIIRLGQGCAVNVLAKLGLDLQAVRSEVEKQVGPGSDQKWAGNTPYTPRVKKVLALAAKEAKSLNHTYVGTEHILLGLLREGDGMAACVLRDLDVDIEQTRQEILKELDPNCSPKDEGPMPTETPSSKPPKPGPEPVDTSKRYDVYCREGNQEVIHRKVLFKRAKTLLPRSEHDLLSQFLEIEQADGQTIYVSRASVVKFCEHSASPGPIAPPEKG
jgi:ATP-dependent Clp protease ATP-binding subunit ClpA